MPAVSLLLNILWILFGGLWMAAAWVVARISRRESSEKLDAVEADARKLKGDAAPTDGAAVHHHAGEGPPLVGQAGPPRAGRRGVRQTRGRR